MKQSILTALLAVHSTSAQDISEDALTGLNLRCVAPSEAWYVDEEMANDVVIDVQSCFTAGQEMVAENIELEYLEYNECYEAKVTEGGAFICKAVNLETADAVGDIREGQLEGAEEGVTYYAW